MFVAPRGMGFAHARAGPVAGGDFVVGWFHCGDDPPEIGDRSSSLKSVFDGLCVLLMRFYGSSQELQSVSAPPLIRFCVLQHEFALR